MTDEPNDETASQNPYESHEADVSSPSKDPSRSKDLSAASPRKPLVPPLWVWIVVAFTVAMIMVMRVRDVGGDHAIVNILTLILGFLAYCTLALWFLFFSGYSGMFRVGCCVAVVASVTAFFTMFRIGHVSGELIPTFRSRWAPPIDALLETASEVGNADGVDLATTTEKDFPQWLGTHRNGTVSDLKLERDWDRHPPELLWRQPIGAGWSGFVAVNGFALTMEQRGEEELVTCYEIATGKLRWGHGEANRHHTILGGTGPRSTPVIHEGYVYTLGPSGSFLCLDGATGKMLWHDNILERYHVPPGEDRRAVAWGRSNSPLIVDDLVVVPVGGPEAGPRVSLAAFNRVTGELVWEAGDRQVSFASPTLAAIGDQQMIVSVNEDTVSGHAPQTGDVLWEIAWKGSSVGEANVSQATLLSDGRLLLSKGYSTGAALWQLSAEANGNISATKVWDKRTVLKTKLTNHVIRQGFAYGLSDGIAECIAIDTGKKQWKKGRYGHGQVLLVDDVLVIQAESGEVVMVEATPDRFHEVAKFVAIEGKTWNTPCLYGDLLLVRNAEEAACYRLPTVD
ncbi:MAG: PQQ-binding-like beta-propeller repeat protein [Planctomycetes bacterium]|nr:PQQ-binding-like beta-propeller repeat protein [Planctomycetota bacterium]